jgi:uncharacterized surface protein with fasciclin (FAS1) repeats
MKNIFALGFGVMALALASCAPMNQSAQATPAATPAATMGDIVDVAAANSTFSTLVAAVKAGDLVATLKGKGPFTVFAPTNAAFAKLPAGTVETLLKPENKATLVKILTYHVISGDVKSSAVVTLNGQKVKTVQGQELTVNVMGSSVSLTDAMGNKSNVTAVDVAASNGTIHVIDSVLLPK